MSTLKAAPRFIGLLILLSLIVTGCGAFQQAQAPAEEAAPPSLAGEVESNLSAVERESEEAAVEEKAGLETTSKEAAVDELTGDGEVAGSEGSRAAIAGDRAEEAPAAAPAEAVDAEAEPAYRDDDAASAGPAPTPSPAPTASAVEVEEEAMTEADRAEAPDAIEIQQSEPLRAGEVDDNALWDDYLLYRRDYRGPRVHDRDVSERYVIEVVDGQRYPVLGATVRVFASGQQRREIYSARTYANGQVLFHPQALDISVEQADSFLVEVQQGSLLEQFSLTRFEAQAATSFSERWTVQLDSQSSLDSLDLDVLFLIDATGSMADEIAKIQNTIFDVAAQIDALPGQPNARYGMVTYRDRGDSFVSNTYHFTPDVRDFHANLSTVFADGGGDYPESLNEGLHNALDNVEWHGGEAIQLIFLIADAPPHLDYAQDYDYAEEMVEAARRGIKVFPIASSGLDDQGEYIFRQIAQFTQGRFIFLTYEGPTNGGAPGEETTHHVDDYSVQNLDDLLVRLVEEELAFQSPRLVRAQ